MAFYQTIPSPEKNHLPEGTILMFRGVGHPKFVITKNLGRPSSFGLAEGTKYEVVNLKTLESLYVSAYQLEFEGGDNPFRFFITKERIPKKRVLQIAQQAAERKELVRQLLQNGIPKDSFRPRTKNQVAYNRLENRLKSALYRYKILYYRYGSSRPVRTKCTCGNWMVLIGHPKAKVVAYCLNEKHIMLWDGKEYRYHKCLQLAQNKKD